MEVVGLKGETDLFFYERPKMSPQKMPVSYTHLTLPTICSV